MSDDTQVKQKHEAPNPHNAPDEIWLGLRGKSWEWDGCWNIRPFPINEGIVVERYVRADLLTTVRREAFKEAIRIAQESAKKSQAASLDIAAAEILIRRLEIAAKE